MIRTAAARIIVSTLIVVRSGVALAVPPRSGALLNAVKSGSAHANVRIVPLASLHLWPARLAPWSPRETLLALTGPDGIYVFDAGQPRRAARRIVACQDAYVSWSPDGTWLACALLDPRAQWETIVAVPAAGGNQDTLYNGQTVWPFLWASDGYIYCWQSGPDGSQIRQRLSPPARWQSRYFQPFEASPALVLNSRSGPLSYRRFDCSPQPTETNLPALDSLAACGNLLLREHFPTNRQWLMTGPGGETLIVDEDGRVVRSFPRGITWSSVSADGRFLAGYREVDTEADVASAQLFIGDALGTWAAAVDGIDYAIEPRLSRRGFFIAYQGRRGYEIARLEAGSH